LIEKKRRGRISFVGLPVQPTRSMPRKAARDLVREKLTLLLRRAEIRRREIGERSAESGSGDERFGDPGTIDRQWLQIHSCSGFGTYSESERSGRRVLCLSVPRGGGIPRKHGLNLGENPWWNMRNTRF
jgi:hypothetical protein